MKESLWIKKYYSERAIEDSCSSKVVRRSPKDYFQFFPLDWLVISSGTHRTGIFFSLKIVILQLEKMLSSNTPMLYNVF